MLHAIMPMAPYNFGFLQARNPAADALLCPMELDDPTAVGLRGKIEQLLDAALSGPADLLSSFLATQQELQAFEGQEGHLHAWKDGQHSLQDTAEEIERLLQVGAMPPASMHTWCARSWLCNQQLGSPERI
jgi:hypothetical protein